MNRMKKFLTIFLCATMILSILPSSAAFAESDDLKSDVAGDVNGDGRLDGADLVRLKKYVSGNPVSIAFNCADVDASGGVNADDLTLLSEYMAGIASSLATPDPSGVILAYSEPEEEHIVVNSFGEYYVDNEVLVTAIEGTSRNQIEQMVLPYGGTIVGCISLTNDYQIKFNSVHTEEELNSIITQILENSAIETADINYLFIPETAMIPNDSEWSATEWSTAFPEGINWGVEAIHAQEAWEYLGRMTQVNVGVIDGMFMPHLDLKYTKIWNNPEVPGNTHGTHTSGTIAAGFNNGIGIAGVAPKVNLYGYSMLLDNTDVISKKLTGFMEWKYALARLIVSGCRVINVSMVHTCYGNSKEANKQKEIFGSFLNKMLQKGYDYLIVQSAGNDSKDASGAGLFTAIDIPAVRDRIIIVGAVKTNGSSKSGLFDIWGDRVFDGYSVTNFSNYGSVVDIVAPGQDIYSCSRNNGYEYNSGTSMAAPHVTGTAALCFSVNPGLSGSQVKKIIIDSCTESVKDTYVHFADSILDDLIYFHDARTYPLLNAYEAVKSALGTSGQTTSITARSNSFIMGNVKAKNGTVLPVVNIVAYADRVDRCDFVTSTQADQEGNFELIVPSGTYHISVSASGYKTQSIVDLEAVTGEFVYLDNIRLVPNSEDSVNTMINAEVRNALTNNSISDVTVRLRQGWNNKTRSIAKTLSGDNAVTQTDEQGYFSIAVQAGNYTAELSKDGYVTGYANLISSSNGETQTCVISPTLSDNEYRIVLTWGETPSDLDSHISGPLSNGSIFHVYYGDMNAYDGDLTTAMLDIDDTTSYGPETITLTCTQNGVYRYSVHDYTNRSSTSSKELSTSGAKVQVYCGNNLIKTYNVPNNKEGTVWNVFEIEDGVIRNINTMEIQEEPSLVAMSLGEIEAASAGILERSPLKDYELMEDIEELDEDEPEETQEPEQLPKEPVEETSEPSEEQMQPEEPRELPELPVEEISDQPEDQITPEEPVEQHDELVPDEALSEGKVPEELEAPELEMELEPTVQDEIDWQIETDNKMVMDEIVQAEGEEVSQG